MDSVAIAPATTSAPLRKRKRGDSTARLDVTPGFQWGEDAVGGAAVRRAAKAAGDSDEESDGEEAAADSDSDQDGDDSAAGGVFDCSCPEDGSGRRGVGGGQDNSHLGISRQSLMCLSPFPPSPPFPWATLAKRKKLSKRAKRAGKVAEEKVRASPFLLTGVDACPPRS